MEILKLNVREFLLQYYLKNFSLENYFVFNEDLGYMKINEIYILDGRMMFHYNECEDYVSIDCEDTFYIYKIV